MPCISVDDVAPLAHGDFLELLESQSLENVGRAMLAASKVEGVLGSVAREAVVQALALRNDEAFRQLRQLLPPEIADLLEENDFAVGVRFMTDGNGAFAWVVPGRQVCFGSREEIARGISVASMRAVRRVAGSTDAPASGRYRAAAMARPLLKVLG